MIAPTAGAEFVAAMEDVLEVYARPPDASRPLVCLDECTRQLTREVRAPMPAAPGRPAREDCEYERHGVAAIFCAVAPHVGWRRIEERERKTRVDCAHFLRALCDEHFAGAEKIVLVQDHLNTHRPASLDEAFPPAEAARIRARFEFASLRSPCGLPAAGYLAALGSRHAQARELAEHRLDRTQCADARLPRPTHPGPHRTCPRTRRVGA